MSVIAPGTPAPAFRLAREDGSSFTEQDLRGQGTVLVFYPFAFSHVNIDIPGRKAPDPAPHA
jgi:peroxiredoxin